MLSLLPYLVLHISLGSFGGRGENLWMKVKVWRGREREMVRFPLSEADVESQSVNDGYLHFESRSVASIEYHLVPPKNLKVSTVSPE